MNKEIREKFEMLWARFFADAELPVTFFYTDSECDATAQSIDKSPHCIISQLIKVRRGESISLDQDNVKCNGAGRYLGYSTEINKRFPYFLSDGSDGGFCERYKKTPQLVMDLMPKTAFNDMRGKKIVFKRWDKLTESDSPEVVLFFGTADTISGLFTLASFDNNADDCVITPFGSGCYTTITKPYSDFLLNNQRATIGLFDPSARKCVKDNILSIAIPINMFLRMVDNMELSFLTTDSWEVIKKRIK